RTDEASLDRAWAVARRFRDTEIPALQDTFGWILHRRGESEEALPYLEGAAQGLPNDPLVQYHLGKAYEALERPEDALAQFRKVVQIAGPEDQREQVIEARDLIAATEN
ncbi:tetratricopeptide repeat protein, partial [Roseobacter litoralis]